MEATADPTLLEEVLVVPRRAYFQFPGLQVLQRPGWSQLLAPSLRQGGFNEVSLAVLDPAVADEVIDATVDQYRRQGVRFRWAVGPDSRPHDLAERLERRGLVRTWVQGMALRLEGWRPASLPPGLRVEEAVDPEGVERFVRLMARGWEVDPGPLLEVHRHLPTRGPDRPRLFIALRDGVPAGGASYQPFPGSAYLMGGVVLPEHRRSGVYRALVSARLSDAWGRGLRLATSQALEGTSAPLLARWGFFPVCRFPVFRG